jgi:hypothetical protein
VSSKLWHLLLCFMSLHGHQQSRNRLRTIFIIHLLSCINKFGTIPNCIFCSTCVCIHYAGHNSKCVSHVHTSAGLQKSIFTKYLPHLLTCMVRPNNFVFIHLGPTMKRLPRKSFHSYDISRYDIYDVFPFVFSCI